MIKLILINLVGVVICFKEVLILMNLAVLVILRNFMILVILVNCVTLILCKKCVFNYSLISFTVGAAHI